MTERDDGSIENEFEIGSRMEETRSPYFHQLHSHS